MNHTNRVTIITHTDGDGYASAAVIKQLIPTAEVVLSNYGRKPPYHKLTPNQTIYITDFSFDLRDMQMLDSQYDLIWIDHHSSKIEAAKQAGFNPKGLRDDSRAACILVWQYFHQDTPPPRVLLLVEDLDIWKFELPNTLEFDFGMRTTDTRPYDKNIQMWYSMLKDEHGVIDDFIGIGKQIAEYLDIIYKLGCEDLCYDTEIDGKQVLCANTRGFNSLFFQPAVKDHHDACLLFAWIGSIGIWRCSIYQLKPDVDVSAIAKKFGGGGHKGASGFGGRTLPFKLEANPEFQEKKYHDFRTPQTTYLQGDDKNLEHVKKYAVSGDKIALNSQMFFGEFCGHNCIIVNHPSIYKDLFWSKIEPYEKTVLISFVWANCGAWRVVVHNTDLSGGLDLNEVAKVYDGVVIDQTDDLPCTGTLIFYVNELPFKLRKRNRQ